ncbi:hypothetical protein ACWEOI_22710 [Nocardia sp. NPDC004340]
MKEWLTNPDSPPIKPNETWPYVFPTAGRFAAGYKYWPFNLFRIRVMNEALRRDGQFWIGIVEKLPTARVDRPMSLRFDLNSPPYGEEAELLEQMEKVTPWRRHRACRER